MWPKTFRQLFDFVLALCAIMGLMAAIIMGFAQAHTAPSGWAYPPECCSGYDCAPISKIEMLPDGSRRITNGNGHTGIFSKDFTIRRPGDDKPHACISPHSARPICLFLPAEI